MKPHRTDALSLTFGLIFVGAVVVWVLSKVVDSELPVGWFVAGALIVAGAIGLVTALRSDRSKAASDTGDPERVSADEPDTASVPATDPIFRDPETVPTGQPAGFDKTDEIR